MKIKKGIVSWILIAIAVLGGVTAVADNALARGTVICGTSLCTVGDAPDYQRKCLEIKNTKKNKCDYKCMGYKEERPSKCKKDGYECVSYAKSRNNCADENGGRSIDPNNKPNKYKNYREAAYTDYERSHTPKCTEGVTNTQLCVCGTGGAYGSPAPICGAGQVCTAMQLQGGKYHHCVAAGSVVGNNNSTTNANNNVSSVDGSDTQQEVDENIGDHGCKTIAQYLARYTSGCWSCMVVGNLTSAFLSAAQSGIGVTEKAGRILLMWGFVLWLCFWALKNVSSFSEIKGGNVLNDLLKTAAKVVLAYICINAGAVAIRNFIITPIMGVGATIAQNFWSVRQFEKTGKSVKDYTENFEWDFTEKDVEELRLEAQDTINGEVVTAESDLTDEEKAENDAINQENREKFSKSAIPNFLIPGVLNGNLSSPAGPRNCDGCSGCHNGVDIGQGCTGNPSKYGCQPPGCIPYVAAGPGTLSYRRPNGQGNAAGFSATIDHGVIGGHRWQTRYFHMRPGSSERFNKKPSGVNYRVEQGEEIGCLGNSGGKYVVHGHFEVLYDGENVDPMMLPSGHIVYVKDLCKCGCRNNENSSCPAAGRGTYTIYKEGKAVGTGWAAGGEGIVMPVGSGNYGGEEVVTQIPEYKFKGNSAIIPASIMNSMLGATKAITDTTAQMMVLGNMAMCYSHVKGGGAWTILKLGGAHITVINIFMWLDGAILWLLGFVLTCIVAYYLVDISFKIGLAVMAFPLVMGLWPFKVTHGKLAETIAIIARSAAIFAFLALTSYYAIELLAASLGGQGGLQGIYDEYDSIITNTVKDDERDEIIEKLDSYFHLFSAGFLLMLFGCIYGYKLIRKTTEDLAEKFYSDGALGGQNPMHKGMTGVASMANQLNNKWGTGLVKDMAANKVGKGVKNLAGRGAQATKSLNRAVAGGARSLFNKIRGKQ